MLSEPVIWFINRSHIIVLNYQACVTFVLTLWCMGAESAECETVTFADWSGKVCAPSSNTLTSGAEFAEIWIAWNDCATGESTVGCEEAAQDWFGAMTGCTSCGPAAGNLQIAVTVSSPARLIWF